MYVKPLDKKLLKNEIRNTNFVLHTATLKQLLDHIILNTINP